MTRAVLVCFHNYCPNWDHKYFNVISDYFMKNYKEFWKDEIDKLYVLDSTWDFNYEDDKLEVIKVDPKYRYYDAYKMELPKVKEDYIMFMDNDTVVYRKGVVDATFKKLEEGYDVVSIYDTIGRTFTKLMFKSKFCPYWFATKTQTLMKYLGVNWGPQMPEHETLGRLTREMLNDGLEPYEWEEDKTDEGKDLGYYHIRAGSVPAYLLTHKHFGSQDTYWDYLKDQPESEIIRQCNWFDRMGGDTSEIRSDLNEKKDKPTN